MSSNVYSFATRKPTSCPLQLLERLVEKAESLTPCPRHKVNVITCQRAWTRLLQPFGASLDNNPIVVTLSERLLAVVEKAGVYAGPVLPKADDPTRLIHELKTAA